MSGWVGVFEVVVMAGVVIGGALIPGKEQTSGIERASGERRGGTSFVHRLAWLAGLPRLLKGPDATQRASMAAAQARQEAIIDAIRKYEVPAPIVSRLKESREGKAPWLATLSPAELLISRTHGLRPIAAVSATCWMQFGRSWSEGHAEGWNTALTRLRQEALAAGANAVVDVKLRTVQLESSSSMDFTLVGTAVTVDGLPPSDQPIVATVAALEFVKLLEAGIVPTGIAIGADYEWFIDSQGSLGGLIWRGNTECPTLSNLWYKVRQRAHSELRRSAGMQGNGALAYVNFSQMFEQEVDKQPTQYLARHIILATVIDAPPATALPATTLPDFRFVVDMHAGKTPLKPDSSHQSGYLAYETEGAI